MIDQLTATVVTNLRNSRVQLSLSWVARIEEGTLVEATPVAVEHATVAFKLNVQTQRRWGHGIPSQ